MKKKIKLMLQKKNKVSKYECQYEMFFPELRSWNDDFVPLHRKIFIIGWLLPTGDPKRKTEQPIQTDCRDTGLALVFVISGLLEGRTKAQ